MNNPYSHITDRTNVRTAHCRECRQRIQPGEGFFSSRIFADGYYCQPCAVAEMQQAAWKYQAWLTLEDQVCPVLFERLPFGIADGVYRLIRSKVILGVACAPAIAESVADTVGDITRLSSMSEAAAYLDRLIESVAESTPEDELPEPEIEMVSWAGQYA